MHRYRNRGSGIEADALQPQAVVKFDADEALILAAPELDLLRVHEE
jgi:hypothetical protein